METCTAANTITCPEIDDQICEELQSRFDGPEFFCAVCGEHAKLLAAFLLSVAPRGGISAKHLSWQAIGFCCRHLQARVENAFEEASEKLRAVKAA